MKPLVLNQHVCSWTHDLSEKYCRSTTIHLQLQTLCGWWVQREVVRVNIHVWSVQCDALKHLGLVGQLLSTSLVQIEKHLKATLISTFKREAGILQQLEFPLSTSWSLGPTTVNWSPRVHWKCNYGKVWPEFQKGMDFNRKIWINWRFIVYWCSLTCV